MKVQGYDDAIIGSCAVTNRLIYSVEKMVDVFIKNSNLRDDDDILEIAIEYVNVNIIGAYVGEMTPIYMYEYNPEWGELFK
jgi:hypothetical protein